MHERVALNEEAGFMLVDVRRIYLWAEECWRRTCCFGRWMVLCSRGQTAQCDLVFLRDPAATAGEESLTRVSVTSAILGVFDYFVSALRHDKAVERRLCDRTGGDFVADLERASRRMGRATAVSEIRIRFRARIPLIGSVFGGIPPGGRVISGY